MKISSRTKWVGKRFMEKNFPMFVNERKVVKRKFLFWKVAATAGITILTFTGIKGDKKEEVKPRVKVGQEIKTEKKFVTLPELLSPAKAYAGEKYTDGGKKLKPFNPPYFLKDVIKAGKKGKLTNLVIFDGRGKKGHREVVIATCDEWNGIAYYNQVGELITKDTFLESFWYANKGKFTDRKLLLTPDPIFGVVLTGRSKDGKYHYLYISNVLTEARGTAGPNTMVTVTLGLPLENVVLKLGKDGKTVEVYGKKDGWGLLDEMSLSTGKSVKEPRELTKEEIAKIFGKEKKKK